MFILFRRCVQLTGPYGKFHPLVTVFVLDARRGAADGTTTVPE